MLEIPPLFHNGDIVSDCLSKVEIFNSYFALQCTPLDDYDEVPSFCLRTPLSFSTIKVSEEQIIYMNRAVYPNKTCGGMLSPPTRLRFVSRLWFPLSKLLLMVVFVKEHFQKYGQCHMSIHKNESKYVKENYLPISLLPILGKMFEKVIFDSLYDYFVNNKLLILRQSGFIKGDSCVDQLLVITHKFTNSQKLRYQPID